LEQIILSWNSKESVTGQEVLRGARKISRRDRYTFGGIKETKTQLVQGSEFKENQNRNKQNK